MLEACDFFERANWQFFSFECYYFKVELKLVIWPQYFFWDTSAIVSPDAKVYQLSDSIVFVHGPSLRSVVPNSKRFFLIRVDSCNQGVNKVERSWEQIASTWVENYEKTSSSLNWLILVSLHLQEATRLPCLPDSMTKKALNQQLGLAWLSPLMYILASQAKFLSRFVVLV